MEEGRNMKKIVLITGASSDIGSEIASLLGDSYEVILHYNNNYDEVMKLKDKLDKLYNTDEKLVNSFITRYTLSGRLKLIKPLEVLDFHNFLANSYLILTDSGGIQEEAPSLGKPVLVLRDTTERPEGIKAGTLKLVGTDEETIYEEVNKLLSDHKEYSKMSNASNPYGDGTASKQIADILEKNL